MLVLPVEGEVVLCNVLRQIGHERLRLCGREHILGPLSRTFDEAGNDDVVVQAPWPCLLHSYGEGAMPDGRDCNGCISHVLAFSFNERRESGASTKESAGSNQQRNGQATYLLPAAADNDYQIATLLSSEPDDRGRRLRYTYLDAQERH